MQRTLVHAYRALQVRLSTLTGDHIIIAPHHIEFSQPPKKRPSASVAARAKRARASSARRSK